MNDTTPPPIPPPPPYAQASPPRSKGCRNGCLVAGGACLVLLVLGVVGMRKYFAAFEGFARAAEGENNNGDAPDLAEVWSAGDRGGARVARVHINGVIMLNNDRWGMGHGSPDLALAAIRRATADASVRGLLIELNSPGGGITASDILHKAVMEFRESDPERKVVVLMNDLAASGAYYVACAANEIVAHPTTLTGSIGVIMQSYNINRLADSIGVTDVTIKSGANKDLLNPFKPVNEEQLALLQPLVDNMHARFVGIVSEGRALPPEVVGPLADGRLYDAQTARLHNLIDVIGYRRDSEARMAALLGGPVTIFRYEENFRLAALFRQSFMRYQGNAGLGATLREALLQPEARFMYLWRP